MCKLRQPDAFGETAYYEIPGQLDPSADKPSHNRVI